MATATLSAMIPREAAPSLLQLAGWYPVVALTGPLQAGKTTLARSVFQDKPYASMEDAGIRAFALADPGRFLGQYPEGAILDEANTPRSCFPICRAWLIPAPAWAVSSSPAPSNSA
jgi:predicted AAA+ superfamily ATPase